MSEVVISSRIRLARNLAGFSLPYPMQLGISGEAIESHVRKTILETPDRTENSLRRSGIPPREIDRARRAGGAAA